jgi:hypothetical protein
MTGNCSGSLRNEVQLGPVLAWRYHGSSQLSPSSLIARLMPGSAFTGSLRSTIVAAFLTMGLPGCGNAQSGSADTLAADTLIQDWETEPPLWVPRPILVAKTVPAASVPDSATNSDSVPADWSTGDSAKPATSTIDSARPVARVKSKKSIFNVSSADSARWPVPGPDPLLGSIIPEHRIVAFYGNPLSKRMGILGEIDPEEMLRRLEAIATEWAAADSGQKVLPALHLIATVAQGYPGPARKYRLQMPDSVIERVADWVEKRGWILILDIQPGLSSVEAELPVLLPYLKRPYVHLALDPEFAMKDGHLPGRDWMGNMDASEVNHAVDVLAKVVEEHQLPPKVLVVHRFTRNMLKNASRIKLDPRVQVVIDMDGYGSPGSKMGAYRWFVVRHPVQYTGFKLFFKNDKPMMKPAEVLELYPKPMYIQYQ